MCWARRVTSTAPAGAGVAGMARRDRGGAQRASRRASARRCRAETGAIAAALITGDTHAIPPADADAFRNAGLAHILVIAGLHMGMVAGIVFFAVRALLALVPRMALYHPTKKYAAVAALAAIFGYMLLSGATVSSRRAFVMIGLALLAVLVDRLSVSARAVALCRGNHHADDARERDGSELSDVVRGGRRAHRVLRGDASGAGALACACRARRAAPGSISSASP